MRAKSDPEAGVASVKGARPVGRFGAEDRLRRRADFQAVQARGRRVRTPHFIVLLANPTGRTDGGPRLGITASRRVGNAVIRNRAKRLVREAFRSTRQLFPEPVDWVVVVRGPLTGLRLSDVVREIEAQKRELRQAIDKATASSDASGNGSSARC